MLTYILQKGRSYANLRARDLLDRQNDIKHVLFTEFKNE